MRTISIGARPMSWIEGKGMKKRKKSREQEVREFGVVMTLALVILGGVLFSRGKESSFWFFLLSLLFLAPAVFCPLLLQPLERVWMAFGRRLGLVVTHVLLALTFYLGFFPLRMLAGLLGKRFLELEFEPERETYWVKVEKDGPGARPYAPY